jgi:hypothetical protein
MSEWWTYEPADLLLFSARVYYRLIEAHNAALWPAQLVALALGLVLVFVAVRAPPPAARIAGVLLGLAWLWVAWSFLWERYATINWAMTYIAPVFALQGAALIAVGLTGDRLVPAATGALRRAAVALLAAAVVLYPLIAPALGRPWGEAEVFAVMPDPTAAATLAYLALARRGGWLMIVPALWCALSSETLALLGAPDFFVPAAFALAAIVLRLARALGKSSV